MCVCVCVVDGWSQLMVCVRCVQGGDESNLQAVAEFLVQYYSPTDLEQYLGEFGLPVEHIAKVSERGEVYILTCTDQSHSQCVCGASKRRWLALTTRLTPALRQTWMCR